MRTICLVACLAFVPLLVVAHGQAAQTDTEAWVSVKDWMGGTGTTTTEEFTVPADGWRVNYKSVSGARFGLMDIKVRDADGKLVAARYGIQPESGKTAGFLAVPKAGKYKIEIIVDGLDWVVAAEHKK